MINLSHSARIQLAGVWAHSEAMRAAGIHGPQQDIPVESKLHPAWGLPGPLQAQRIVETAGVDLSWFDILMEEICELAAESEGTHEFRAELVQVAAMALVTLAAHDARWPEAVPE